MYTLNKIKYVCIYCLIYYYRLERNRERERESDPHELRIERVVMHRFIVNDNFNMPWQTERAAETE